MNPRLLCTSNMDDEVNFDVNVDQKEIVCMFIK